MHPPFDAQFRHAIMQPYGVTAYEHPPQFPQGHTGVDYQLTDKSNLYAVSDGVVTDNNNWTLPGKPRGYAIELTTAAGARFVYGHASEFLVANGARVSAGQLIGRSGGRPGEPGAGYTTGPHLHFEVYNPGGVRTNPEPIVEAMFASATPQGDTNVTPQEAGAIATSIMIALYGGDIGRYPANDPKGAPEDAGWVSQLQLAILKGDADAAQRLLFQFTQDVGAYATGTRLNAIEAQLKNAPPGGVTMDQVKAEIAKVLKAAEGAV